MSCLALSLQPINGPDILLQTREWFPPSRALSALSSFRSIRHSLSSSSKSPKPTSPSSSPSPSDPSLVGDDPLQASSGQLIVGVESKFRVIYRLVNCIYVLAITTPDDADYNNVFECISIVNQAVSVVVTACRGVDVTPEKLAKKYAEVYMALDIVLRGVSNIRLAAMLASLHGESIAKMVHSSIDTENKVRGGESWVGGGGAGGERESGVEVFGKEGFEMPSEAIMVGDEVAMSMRVEEAGEVEETEKSEGEGSEVKDPFAASDGVSGGGGEGGGTGRELALVGEFRKDKEMGKAGGLDVEKALVGLEVTSLPPAEAAQPTHIAVEGFEGDYGGIEFSNEEASLRETFEGFSEAFGGGLDVSEFVGSEKVVKREGLGGLELLQTGPDGVGAVKKPSPIDGLLEPKSEMKGPEMYICEEICAEFRDCLLTRVGLMGVVYLRTLPTKMSGEKETEFSFRIDGTTAVKRVVMDKSRVSSVGNGMFHVRTAASDEALPVLRYSLMPQMTPVPLRVRLVKRHVGSLLSVMIQYVSNPDLPMPLTDVTFVLKLPVDPSLLKVSPKAVLNRTEKELKWHVSEIPLNGTPGKLKARMPVDINEEDAEEEIDVVCNVKFSMKRPKSLSGVSLWPAAEGKIDFYVVDHKVESGTYMCN